MHIIIPLWYNYVKGGCPIFRLKELRIKNNLSQAKLADELNMYQTSISRYESGAREAGYAELIALADYFNVSVDYLLGRTDNPEIAK